MPIPSISGIKQMTNSPDRIFPKLNIQCINIVWEKETKEKKEILMFMGKKKKEKNPPPPELSVMCLP